MLTEFDENEYQQTNSKHNIWFNDSELSKILQHIIGESNKVDAVNAIRNSVGSITTQTLKYWKFARLELEQSNTENLKLIDDALFVLILDSILRSLTVKRLRSYPMVRRFYPWTMCKLVLVHHVGMISCKLS